MEEWKKILEATNYEVSNMGNIRNSTTKQVLKGRLSKSGYLQVNIKDNITLKFKNQYIHRLVAQYWVDNPKSKKEVNHKDGNKINNQFQNLEWVTSSENQLHKQHILGKTKTSNHKVGKFSLDGELLAEYNSIQEAANMENNGIRVSIDNVVHGRRKTLKGYVWKILD